MTGRAPRGELILDESELAEVFDDWDRLAVERGRPYAAPAWMMSWWRNAAPHGSGLRVVVVKDGGSVIGIAPLYAAETGVQFASYRTLGVGSFREPLAAPGVEREVAQAVANTLAASEPRPRCVSLEAIGASSLWTDALVEAWPSRRQARTTIERTETAPELELTGSFADWFTASTGHFRKHMRTYHRQLDTMGAKVRQAEPTELSQALDAFVRLHHARWRNRGGSTALTPPIERMVRDASKQLTPDRFRLWLIELNDEIVCAEILVAAGGVVASWLGGFDQRLAAQSPSMVTIVAAIEQCFAHGDRRLDLGPGRQKWKYRLSRGEQRLTWLSLIPPGRGSLRIRSRIAGTRLKRDLIERLPEPQRTQLRRMTRKVRRR
jgi:CelD/BcsL family acetyltransferase involved in cellulose biosynthesis